MRPSSRAFNVAFRLVSSTLPVFFRIMNALVTSPIPWVTSMLVLQPKTSKLTAGAGVIDVAVSNTEGVSVMFAIGVSVTGANGVWVITKAVAIIGVDVLPPITTGVGETIEGVCVAGRKGVG